MASPVNLQADDRNLRINDKNQQIQERLDRKAKRKNLLSNILPFTGLVFIFLFFLVVTNGKLVNVNNLENLINQSFTLTIVAVGAAFVYANGGMDFSIGASCGVAQLVTAALLAYTNTPVWLAFLICLVTGIACSGLVGGSALLFGVPVFVASLCVRSICMGILATVVSRNEIIIQFTKYADLNNTGVKAVVLIAVILIGIYLFRFCSLGKYEKAIGGNILTTGQAGVKTKKVTFISYILLGVCVGIAGFFSILRAGNVTAQSGSGLEFNIMTAIVLGGFPLTGGDRANIQSAIIGALTVTILSNGLALWGLDPMLVNGVKGALFLIIVGLSYDRSDGKLVA